MLTVVDLVETSDREQKADVEAVDARALLGLLGELPLSTWRHQSGVARHIGPMAQDFHALFGLGPDERHVRPGDVAGVALAGVQALRELLAEREAQIAAQQERIEALTAGLVALERQLAGLQAQLAPR